MAVREFRDISGRKWRAWEVKPEEIHPVTKGEDYLADCYVTGWIVFETISGDEKRRLSRWPMRWTQESEAGLRKLLAKAEVVPPHKLRGDQPPAGEDKPDVTDLGVVRTFRYPGGRVWTVCVVTEIGGPPVLRFTSGVRSIDLSSWPKAWADEPDDSLAVMLRLAAPRPPTTAFRPDAPRRRWDDQPPQPRAP